jgi:hypothetical protein
METSQTIGKISEALAKAQGQMKPALFDAKNPHYNSSYASLTSMMETARVALSANNLAVVQGSSVEEGKVMVTTMIVHSSGEWIRDSLSIKLAREDAQAIGSAITYARRYSLASMVGIVSDDDDGEAAVGRPTTVPSPKPILTTVKKVTDQPKTTKTNSPKSDATKVENSKPTVPAPANSQPATVTAQSKPATSLAPAKSETPVTPPANGNGRVAKVRIIFTLSSQLGHSPEQMKSAIGALLGLNKPIKESSEIPNDQLDKIISAFQQDLANQNQTRKEAA